jgi:hypothetical protein
VTCRQGGELEPTIEEQGVSTDHERVGSLAHKRGESCVDFKDATRLNHLDLDSHCSTRCRQPFDQVFGIHIARID